MKYRSIIPVLFHTAVVALLVPQDPRSAESPEEIRTRFVSDYGPAVKDLLAVYTNYEVKTIDPCTTNESSAQFGNLTSHE